MKTPIPTKPRDCQVRALILAALASLPPLAGHAADISWTGGTASYTNAANWGGVVPGAADNAINDTGSNNIVQINTGNPDWTVMDFRAGTTDSAAGAYEQNGQTANINGWFRLGMAGNSYGAFTLNNGLLRVQGGRLNLGEFGTGLLVINNGEVRKSGDVFAISDGGFDGGPHFSEGRVIQNGGVVNSASEIWIGQSGGGIGNYALHNGGTINQTNWFVVGRAGATGQMDMDGGTVNQWNNGNFLVGDGNGSIGTLNQTGGTINLNNAEWWVGQSGGSLGTNNISGNAAMNVLNNWIAIGRGGIGELNISGNASVTKAGGGNVVIGAPGTGIINQTGGAFTNTTSEVWLAETGTGIWNLAGGSVILGVLHIAQTASAVGEFNLNGGVLAATEITTGNATGFSTLNLNGGTIRARQDNVDFLRGLSQANVGAGGVTFDSQAFNVTVAQSLADNGGGGVTKTGAGTVALTGGNSYTGPTVVNAGKLVTTSDSTGAGSVTVAAAATLGVKVQNANAQLNAASATFGASTLELDLNAFGNPTAAALNVTGNLTVNGAVTVNVIDGLPQVGQFPLVKYGSRSGAGAFVLGTLPAGTQASLSNNVANKSIDLVIGSVGLPRWEGQAGGNWDIGVTQNWIERSTLLPAFYTEGSPVLFNDEATGTTTVNLVATVNPASVTFTNSLVDYILRGAGKISGATGLLKQGSNTVSLLTANDYNGATVITGGRLLVTNLANGGQASAIGKSSSAPANLTLGGGSLVYAGPAATSDRGYQVTARATGIETVSNLTLSGAVAASPSTSFVKTGQGRLAYTGAGTKEHSGGGSAAGYAILAGTVLFDGTGGGQTNHIQNDFWVGADTNYNAALILSNTTVNVDSWFAAGRGNGTVSNITTVTLFDSRLRSGNSSLGYDNGIAGNFAHQILTLNGSSTYTNAGDSNFGESSGSFTEIFLNDNAVFYSQNRAHIGWHNNATGNLTIAQSAKFVANAWFSIGHEGGTSITTVKNNGLLYIGGDANVTDVNTGLATLNVQDNGTFSGNQVYIAKGAGSVGVLNQTGGAVISRDGGEFHIGSRGDGTYNLSGGTVDANRQWFSIGRYVGAIGTLNMTGGTLRHNAADRLLMIGEEGSGTVNLSGTGFISSVGDRLVLGQSGGSGVLNLDGGTLQVRRIGKGTGSATVNLNGGLLVAGPEAQADFISGLDAVNVNAGGAKIDSGTNRIAINQDLLDGGTGGGLTKTGSGSLFLNGANSYTGATLVNAGSLGGSGSIGSAVTVAVGGDLAPGNAGIGILTVNGSLTLNGSVTIELNNDVTPTSDSVAVSGNLALGGTLNVVLTGTNGLAVNDTFNLLDWGTRTGNFTTFNLPAGYTWDTTLLTVDGTIRVSGLVATPTIAPARYVGGNLILTGTGGTPNGTYTWLTATNIATPAAQWLTNSTGTFDATGAFSNALPVNTAEPARFFRLRNQ